MMISSATRIEPPAPPPRPRGRPSRRVALLATAVRLLGERGIRDLTLEEVSSATGLTRGAIYWHFVSKERLVEEALAATTLPLETLQPPAQDDPCRDVAQALVACIAQESQRVFCQTLLFNAGEPAVRARTARIHNAVTRFLVRHCMPPRSVGDRSGRRPAMCLAQGLLLGLLIECVLSRPPALPDPDALADSLRRILGAEEDKPSGDESNPGDSLQARRSAGRSPRRSEGQGADQDAGQDAGHDAAQAAAQPAASTLAHQPFAPRATPRSVPRTSPSASPSAPCPAASPSASLPPLPPTPRQ
ncbi:helix-turn-helix domain containing protein [Roseateles sp. SL47]|uniref:helix-turn-helix domain containing protein n=1 Tax=Roseateles sp. SL47 TaxID=2995138 RepID=UPI0022719D2A|nr:helix-turn-helix domain containing protein [Roseateles sp. SL47]WAC75388.1 helix-turn-helix domain containing protein [Roseateles sp. SL47]